MVAAIEDEDAIARIGGDRGDLGDVPVVRPPGPVWVRETETRRNRRNVIVQM